MNLGLIQSGYIKMINNHKWSYAELVMAERIRNNIEIKMMGIINV